MAHQPTIQLTNQPTIFHKESIHVNNNNNPVSLPLPEIAADFMLREDVAFFNHGSFGACPRPVFEVYQHWQRELEKQPVDFLGRRARDLLTQARGHLAEFVGTVAGNLVFVPNVTHGVNFVAYSLNLQPGDEVLAPDQEYGAVQAVWEFVCQKKRAAYVTQPISLPVSDPETVVEQLWAGVNERTKVISISHITSPTALIWPLAEICARAREAGIITVIDGAHAVGQLDLDLEGLGADYYTGNCHKWLSGAKGSAFLYARPEGQAILEPLVVNWGWKNRSADSSPLIDYFTWLGTDDPASYLAVPAAIDYQRTHNWPAVRLACHQLGREIRDQIQALSGLPHICPDSTGWWMQMFTVPLPPTIPDDASQRLWNEFQVEVPVSRREQGTFIRVSVQAYNTPQHAERLLYGLKTLIA
jgi:isopenicillin-N epimerase